MSRGALATLSVMVLALTATEIDEGMLDLPITAATEGDRAIYRDIFRTLLRNDGVIDARE